MSENEYNKMSVLKNAFLNADGSIINLANEQISGPNEKRAEIYKTMSFIKNAFLNADGTTTEMNNGSGGGGSTSSVKTVNGLSADTNGDIELLAENILYLVEQGIDIKKAFDFILNVMVTQEQMTLSNMADNFQPPTIIGPMAPYLDIDGNMKYHELTQLGIPDIQEVYLKGGNVQIINTESGDVEVEFGESITKGTRFKKVGNGIQVTEEDFDKPFKLAVSLAASFNNVWLEYPIFATIKLFKNGIYTGISQTYEIKEQSAGIDHINDFDSELIPDLQINDILNIKIATEDSTGFNGDGAWAKFTLGTPRSFSAYETRDLQKVGYYYGMGDIAAKRFVITKTDKMLIPSGNPDTTPYGLIYFNKSTEGNGFDYITYDSATSTWTFLMKKRISLIFLLSFPILKSGGGSGTGGLEFVLHIEYKDEILGWQEYTTVNDSRTFILSNTGRGSADYIGIVPFSKLGEYRMRIFWLDIDSGSLYHDPLDRNVTLGGTIGGTAVTSQRGRVEIIEYPVAATI